MRVFVVAAVVVVAIVVCNPALVPHGDMDAGVIALARTHGLMQG